MELYGNYTAIITPFKTNKEVDYKALSTLATFQLQNNTKGLVALGSTAEAATLTIVEKHKILETIISATENKIPVIAGINSFSLSDALLQSTQRFLDGASALLVSPPPYVKPSPGGLYDYFSKIADSSYIPVILYNIPSRTAINIPVSLVSRLSSHPNIIGIKEASGNLNYCLDLYEHTRETDFSILSGNDNLLLPMISAGAKGIISVIGNLFPNLCNSLIDLFEQNPSRALQEYQNYKDIVDSLSIETNPIPIKYIMYKLGLIKQAYRQPLSPPARRNKTILNKTVSQIKILQNRENINNLID